MAESAASLVIPQGFRAAGAKAGIKASGNLDLAVLVANRPCRAVGTFTTNRIAAAPVHWDREHVPSESIRAIVINSGNANAATGEEGIANVRRTADAAAIQAGCTADQVLVCSTGVIGHQLPMAKLVAGIEKALAGASADADAFQNASQAILTTDTRPKVYSMRRSLGGHDIALLGMAKGAAMIGPRMATMLGFLLTDANIALADLQPILSEAVDRTFNCISVEGHTSTNDTVLLLASGAAGGPVLSGAALEGFRAMVEETCETLARMIPNDGEGALHLITIDVEGCAERAQAQAIARAVADSPLVKTAISGADPNWGRIVSAAGYAGVAFEEEALSLWLDDVLLYENGVPLSFDAGALSARIKNERDVHIRLSLGNGPGSARFWTCDLTAEYVRLNADYTT